MNTDDARLRTLLLVIRQACLQVARGIEEALALPKRTMVVDVRAGGKGAGVLPVLPLGAGEGEDAF